MSKTAKEKEDTKNFLVWSDGNVVSFGVIVGEKEGGTYLVKDPCYLVFVMRQVQEKQPDDTIQVVDKMFSEIMPFVVKHALKDPESCIWMITPQHRLSPDAVLDDGLIAQYEATVNGFKLKEE